MMNSTDSTILVLVYLLVVFLGASAGVGAFAESLGATEPISTVLGSIVGIILVYSIIFVLDIGRVDTHSP